jgi:hypothetical protein
MLPSPAEGEGQRTAVTAWPAGRTRTKLPDRSSIDRDKSSIDWNRMLDIRYAHAKGIQNEYQLITGRII